MTAYNNPSVGDIIRVRITGIKPDLGAFAKMLREYTGKEPTDPSKVAKVMLEVADMAAPPLRLLIGTDAVTYVGAAAKELAESDARWRSVSESVGF